MKNQGIQIDHNYFTPKAHQPTSTAISEQTAYATVALSPQTAYSGEASIQNAPDKGLMSIVDFDMSTPEEKAERAIANNSWGGVSANLEAVMQLARNRLNLQQYIPVRTDGLINPLAQSQDECYARALLTNDINYIYYDLPAFTSWLHEKLYAPVQTQTPVSKKQDISASQNDNKSAIPEEKVEVVPANGTVQLEMTENTPTVVGNVNVIVKQQKKEESAAMAFVNDVVKSPYGLKDKFLSTINIININGHLRVYNGKYYAAVSDKDIEKLLIGICRKDVKYYGTWNLVREALSFIKAEPSIVVKDDDVSTDYLALNNGLLDLNTGRLLPHTPDIITTYGINANYLVGQSGVAHSPMFNRFIARTGEGYPDFGKLSSQFIGYSLSPDFSAKTIFVLQGKSDTGKTVMITFIQMVLSDDSHKPIDVKEIGDKFALEDLPGKVFLTCPDMTAEPLTAKAASRLKQLSGGDLISSDRKYKDRVVFRCRAKIALITNHPIVTKTPDNAFFNRIVTIPFGNPIPKEEMDPNLVSNLFKYERDGIVTEALNEYMQMRWDAKMREQRGEGNRYIFAGNFPINEVVEDDGTTRTSIEDTVSEFVENCFDITPDDRVNTRDAYEAFSRMYGYMGEDLFNKLFNKYIPIYYGGYAVQSRGPKNGASNGPRGFKGIRLKAGG